MSLSSGKDAQSKGKGNQRLFTIKTDSRLRIYTHTIGRIGKVARSSHRNINGTFMVAVDIAVDDYSKGQNITIRGKGTQQP